MFGLADGDAGIGSDRGDGLRFSEIVITDAVGGHAIDDDGTEDSEHDKEIAAHGGFVGDRCNREETKYRGEEFEPSGVSS